MPWESDGGTKKRGLQETWLLASGGPTPGPLPGSPQGQQLQSSRCQARCQDLQQESDTLPSLCNDRGTEATLLSHRTPGLAEMRLLLLVPLLLAPAPGSSALKVRRQSDTWGSWGNWSPCSRTCGGGVSFRERPCYSQRRDGGSSCVGPTRSHHSCRTESCPDGAHDFRAEQCSEFDGQEFQGRRYKWLPYYGAPNKCELNCIPKGENFYYKHREAVIDGTPCEPGKRDICVDGSCRVVGCDHNLDSSKQEDKCLQCGGDGTTCYPITGVFDANDLSRGYNQILIVPVGATSIHIEEVAASRNFLAVKSVHGEYYLNGHWTIEGARALPVASTILHYERGAEGDLAPERLHMPAAPPQSPWSLRLRGDPPAQLISQEPNPGVRFEYHLPLSSPRPGFSWSHSSWGDCSAECGGGHQTRLVFCSVDNEAYPDHMCQHQLRPADRRPCNPHPCPHTKRWKTGPWAPCSASCGGSSQSRSVYCVSSDGAGVQEAAEDTECAGLPGKPPTTQACNLQRCASWSVEPWGEASGPPAVRAGMAPLGEGQLLLTARSLQCSVSCGAGVRRRSITCRGDEGSLLHATACSLEDRPPLTEPCVHDDCPLLTNQAWHIGAWGLCSKSCSSGTRRRQVVCAIGPPGHCESLLPSKPADAEPCNTQPCHLPPEVPSTQDVRTSPRNPWMPLGPRKTPASATYSQICFQLPNPGLPPQAPQAQQNEPSECRGSRFGCCYDNVASAAGPLGEGCVGQPSYAYPVRCLLPSAHGSCTDWAARWYFIASVGQCNRFWYGGCHGNANNFASEEECSTHTDGDGSGPRGQQEASRHGTGPMVQRKPLPSGGLWWHDQEPGPGAVDRRQAFGEQPRGQELGPSAPGLSRDAGLPAPSSHSSSYRITLLGLEPSLVQAALGQLVRLFCPDDTSLDPHAGWQKDGQPISSDRHKLQPDGSLVISPLRAEDAGTYSCGSTRPDHDSQKIQLRITGGDVAVLSEAEARPFPQTRDPAQGYSPRDPSRGGDTGGLGATSSSHPWPTTRHQLQPDGSLVISRVAVEDGGFYTCVAFNGQDRDEHWVQLRVLGELTITGLPSTMTVPEGDTARLLCVVTGESVNIRWSRNGLPVRADGHRVHQSPDGTLLIYNLRARDEGSYTCSAYRGSQAVSRVTEVKVVPSARAAQPRDPSRECIDQPELANCDLILQAQLCGNEYYSSFCCASCSRVQPHAQPIWQQG
ncbi:hypothetical protein CB1_000743115 [Camelus ferus]|nr:hypothetical protein CB1_000743115 [Camelus ferus]